MIRIYGYFTRCHFDLSLFGDVIKPKSDCYFVMKKQYIPNIITGFRLGFTPILLWCIVTGAFASAFVLVCFMSASDAIDGWLAKRCGWETRFGEFFDPLADKVMVTGSFMVLGMMELLPLWLAMIVSVSGIALVAGGVVFYFWFYDSRVRPPWISKLNTFLQLLMIILILFSQSDFGAGFGAVLSATDWLIYPITATTVSSFLLYLFTFHRYGTDLKLR